ncbi:hypothetical protein HK405_013019 [Cladochytrium tenue]|nr:hypothetical protein HK405_013019 [Cladochytrium tenue]
MKNDFGASDGVIKSPFGRFTAVIENKGNTANDDEWKGLRRILETPFTPSNIKKMAPFILRTAKNLGAEFNKVAEIQAAETASHPKPGGFTGKTAVDINPILKKATYDTMMMYALDLDGNKSGVMVRIGSVFKLYRFYMTAEDRKTQAAAEREARQRVEAGGASEIREHSVLDNFIKSQSPEEQKIASEAAHDFLVHFTTEVLGRTEGGANYNSYQKHSHLFRFIFEDSPLYFMPSYRLASTERRYRRKKSELFLLMVCKLNSAIPLYVGTLGGAIIQVVLGNDPPCDAATWAARPTPQSGDDTVEAVLALCGAFRQFGEEVYINAMGPHTYTDFARLSLGSVWGLVPDCRGII